jgi:hypothetical protein
MARKKITKQPFPRIVLESTSEPTREQQTLMAKVMAAERRKKMAPAPQPQQPRGHVEHVMVEISPTGAERIHVYGPAQGLSAAPAVGSGGGVNAAGNFGPRSSGGELGT